MEGHPDHHHHHHWQILRLPLRALHSVLLSTYLFIPMYFFSFTCVFISFPHISFEVFLFRACHLPVTPSIRPSRLNNWALRLFRLLVKVFMRFLFSLTLHSTSQTSGINEKEKYISHKFIPYRTTRFNLWQIP